MLLRVSSDLKELEAAIRALEAQRGLLGDAVVDAMLAPARSRLAALAVPMTPPPESAQSFKQVSILFLDLVGSTTLAQHLDPGAISAVMDGALARGTAIDQAHRGRYFNTSAVIEDQGQRKAKTLSTLLKALKGGRCVHEPSPRLTPDRFTRSLRHRGPATE